MQTQFVYTRVRAAPRCRRTVVQAETDRPVITYEPKMREVAPPPDEVPVVHSSSYLLQDRRRSFSNASSSSSSSSRGNGSADSSSADEPGGTRLVRRQVSSENAVDWVLERADVYLDKIEHDSSSNTTKRLLNNPATQVALKTMQGISTLGAAAAPQIAKAAVPFGKAVLSFGADAVLAGVSALNEASKRDRERASERRRRDADATGDEGQRRD